MVVGIELDETIWEWLQMEFYTNEFASSDYT